MTNSSQYRRCRPTQSALVLRLSSGEIVVAVAVVSYIDVIVHRRPNTFTSTTYEYSVFVFLTVLFQVFNNNPTSRQILDLVMPRP